MNLLRATKRRQRAWAAARAIPLDRVGYVQSEEHNFFLPLSPEFSAALDNAGGGERQQQRHLPAKIRAPHSSAALAINVFQYWEGRTGPELPRALGIESGLASVRIEQQFPSGLRGVPPTLDVVLTLADGSIVAVESKFTEWMAKAHSDLKRFRDKYLTSDRRLWTDAGLPRCQALAAAIADGEVRYRQLNALQLLKHGLGLATTITHKDFSLLYLFYDAADDSNAADLHREELAHFAERVDERLRFRSMSYQALFAVLAETSGVDSYYIGYLKERYF